MLFDEFSAKHKGSSFYHRWIASLISFGSVPKHIAFIMDGNRRFAVSHGLRKHEGHSLGFDKLGEVLAWCRDLNLKEVTIYAFSVENFKRPQLEVDTLMDLAYRGLNDMLVQRQKFIEYNIRVCFVGELYMLPQKVQQLIQEIHELTEKNTSFLLNVCLAYTSRHEMTDAFRWIALGRQRGLIEESDIDDELINSCLYFNHCSPVDLMVRTSGETRLSDFMLYQLRNTCMLFFNVHWPALTRWHIYAAVLYYQYHVSFGYFGLFSKNIAQSSSIRSVKDLERRQRFCSFVQEQRKRIGSNVCLDDSVVAS